MSNHSRKACYQPSMTMPKTETVPCHTKEKEKPRCVRLVLSEHPLAFLLSHERVSSRWASQGLHVALLIVVIVFAQCGAMK